MADQYISELLRISIAQICQTIGYNAIQTTPLELLQDNLHKFLHEFCRDLRRHVEHYNRNEANLDDVCLTLASLNINVNELLEYILNVQPVTFAIDVPKFPVHKESNLNFLKPGSREVLLRPVHIYEHLPPILPPDDYANESDLHGSGLMQHSSSRYINNSEDGRVDRFVEVKSDHNLTNIDGSILKQEYDGNSDLKDAKNDSLTAFFKAKTNSRMLDEEGRPTREIGSVMMTTGGFISPAIEGKLPDTRIPDIIDILEGLDAPPPPPPPPPPPQRSFTTPRSSSRTSAATPTVAITSAAHQNLGSEEKSLAPSNQNGTFEKSLTPEIHTTQMKQHAAIISPGGIANASSYAITAAAAVRLAKKRVPVQQLAPPPPLAARILKKAKKKSAMMPFSASSKLERSGLSNNSQDPISTSVDMTDKSQRKRMKMLQKLVKSAKATSGEIPSFGDSTGKIKNLHGLFNPTILDSMPSGSKRLQVEKILKRQAKHKQKLLRAQMAIQLQDKPLGQVEFQQQHQQHKRPFLESSKVPSSKMIASTKHLASFMPTMSHLCEKKRAKSPNNTGGNIPSKKARKTSPTTTQNFLNSIPGYRSINALKTASIAAPVFGEAPFSNEQSYKDPPEIKTSEVKLSNEPDRSKLNIFKKISSKQKLVHGSLSPTSDAPVATHIFSGNDNQVINLPSGTTITPAPPTSGRHVYAPDDASFITVEDSNKTNIAEDTSQSVAQSSTPASFFGKSDFIAETESPEAIHKPKKRGRKPGSKNQPKVPGLGPSPAVSPKKPKKMKIQKNLYGPTFQLHAEQRTEPLNLSHSFSSRSDMNSNIPLGVASTYPILDQSGLQKEVAERKKFKIKDAPVSVGDSLGVSLLGMQQNSRDSSKKCLVSPFLAPTKEEVDSINRKLLKMDTVLQPAPPLQQIPMALGPISSVSKEMSMSPIKSVVNTSPGSKHRSLLPRNSAGSFALSSSPLEGTIPGPFPKGFPNLPPNLLPMLPMYSFPPRPGLIPTPGLFPSVLGSFPIKQSNPTANMLLQGFLPFPGLKPSSSGLLRSPGVKMTDKIDNVAIMECSGAERSYCNVAPLVPESVKQKLSSPGDAGSSLISPKHAAFGDRDTPKTPQLKHSPTFSETIRESLEQKFSGLGTPDSRSLSSKSIPSTPGGISLNTFDCLLRGSSGISTNSSTSNNSIGVPDTLRSRALSHSSDNLKNISNIATLNVNSPIEVSDDSEDASTSASTITPKSKGPDSGKHRSQSKPPSLPAPLLGHLDDIFIPIGSTKNIGLNQPYLLSGRNKEVKKSKKQNKTVKNSHAMSTAGSTEFCMSKIGGDSGVGKLAGGADLIPLSATGLAYSSKTTPTNSLTASTASSSFEVSNREFGSSEVVGGDLSVTPSSDAHDKRKKLKKIKYGKIKKKKDKKDKTKNKEKYCEKIEKRIKEKDPEKQRDKDALKKIKKDKKREKQRSTRESLSSPTSVTAPNHNLASACFDMNAMNLSNLPSFPGTVPPINTLTSSVVPKLTLKLGSCQSPTPFDDMKRKQAHKPTTGTTNTVATTRESSPELARISPLVTRPPKQKSISIDSSSHFNTLGGVASSGSNSLGTFTTTELFGDKNRSNNCMNLNISSSPIPPAPSSWSSGGTLTASSTLLPQQLLQSSIIQHTHEEPSISASSTEVATSTTRSNSNMQSPALAHETNRPSSYIDAEGNRVWICPACGKVDDGSAMIGCDGCDAWYHWVCVGIFVAPKDNEDWFCRVCIAKKKGIHGIDKKRKRNKKNK